MENSYVEDRGLEISRKNPVYPGSMEMETCMAGRQEKVPRKVCMHDMIAGRQEKVPRKVCMHDMIEVEKRRFQGKVACMA